MERSKAPGLATCRVVHTPRKVGSSGLTDWGRSERRLDSITVIVDQTSLPTHVRPCSGTRRPIMESYPCRVCLDVDTPAGRAPVDDGEPTELSSSEGTCHE